MKSAGTLWVGLSLLGLAACQRSAPPPAPQAAAAEVAPLLTTPEAKDIHSYADPQVARVTHMDLDLTAHFDSHTMQGTATLTVQARDGATLTLDTRGLKIEAVRDGAGRTLQWSLGAADPILGAPLKIALGGARQVQVQYASGAEAQALQWLSPAQTAGKQHPYLFSQGEAILTRTWVPTQDSPGIRQTWSARVRAPAELTVVMSGERQGEAQDAGQGMREWRYRMQHPVAPYLIAIAIGDIAFEALGTRTGVFTEPSRLPAAASEFVDLEKMVSAAESLYGPYRWGRYDLLILPPSFPFGGMENPRLTFATPTIIAGDRSLVSLVAHELAHSWSGNLVTNATWADYWLNEGFTDYFENRIMERVYGPEFAAMLADLGWDDVQAAIREAGGVDSPDTRLHIDLTGRDPDDAMTDIAYEKGATFLRTIEHTVGRERWDSYLRDYFDRHAFQPQTSAGFLADLRANLIKGDARLEKQLQLDDWVYGTGLPANAVHVKSAAFEKIDAAAAAFVRTGITGEATQGWVTAERVRFLNRLPRKLTVKQLEQLSDVMHLDHQGNSEVRFAWLHLALTNRYVKGRPDVERFRVKVAEDLVDFLTSMGRRKFVLPLFRDLMADGDWGRRLAMSTYATARPGYHSVTAGSVDKVVPLAAAKAQ